MQVYGPSQLHSTQGVSAPHFSRTGQAQSPATPASIDTTDELRLSPAADLAGRMAEIPDIRWERVNAIKAALADGTYLTDEKIGVAVDRLLDEIG